MRVTVNYLENLHFKASARHFENLELDEPESFHGSDLGPSPVEYVLIGVGGCLGSTLAYCFHKNHIEIERLIIDIDGKLSHSGPKLNLRLVNIDANINFSLKNGNNNQIIDKCLKEFTDYCIISSSLIKGIPINIECHNEKKK